VQKRGIALFGGKNCVEEYDGITLRTTSMTWNGLRTSFKVFK